ncbi:MAG: hypothetical protein RLZZ293_93 [Pseudomonadota bacterium]|jgi:hypothetical protein
MLIKQIANHYIVTINRRDSLFTISAAKAMLARDLLEKFSSIAQIHEI